MNNTLLRTDADWFLTYTGKQFFPLNPRPDEIDIVDIAHALSQVCRFGGHTLEPYSVAQHSVLVAEHCPAECQLQGLLHDATEAYCGDMVRPLKRNMPDFKVAEFLLWQVIAQKFGVPVQMHPAVHVHDNRCLMTERRDLLIKAGPAWGLEAEFPPYDDQIVPWSSTDAEWAFLESFRRLSKQVVETQSR